MCIRDRLQHVVSAAALAVALGADSIQAVVCLKMLHVADTAGNKRVLFHHQAPKALCVFQILLILWGYVGFHLF